MTDMEAIAQRISRRSYVTDGIEPKSSALIQALIGQINREQGLSFEWIENGGTAFKGIKSYGMFSGVRAVIALRGPKSDPNLNEKIGYFGERIVLEAVKLSLGTCWVGTSFRKADLVDLPAGFAMPCVLAIGHVSIQGWWEKFIRKLNRRKQRRREYFYTAKETPPEWFFEGIESVRLAPSAMNAQPIHFVYDKGQVSSVLQNDSVFAQIDLGIAKLHFEAATGKKFPLGDMAIAQD